MAPLGGADPLYGTTDPAALRGIAHRLRQHTTEPREICEGLRTIVERMAKHRPHDAVRLTGIIATYERAAVTPHLEAAAGLDALAVALRFPEEVPADVTTP